jgi:hypothetical protein
MHLRIDLARRFTATGGSGNAMHLRFTIRAGRQQPYRAAGMEGAAPNAAC